MSTDYPGGFAGGLTVSGVPINIMKSGEVFFVDSESAISSDGNNGTFDRPFATLDYASTKCTDDAGDIIVCKAGHAESIASATACNLATRGVNVIGLGVGDNRPTFTSTTATAAKVSVDAANVSIKNIKFVCGIDEQVVMLDVNATTVLDGCEVEGSASAQPVTMIDIGGTTGSSSGTVVRGCTIKSVTAGASYGVYVTSVQDGVVIEDNVVLGNFTSSPIGAAVLIPTNILVRGNNVSNANAAGTCITLTSSTGTITNNTCYSPSVAYAATITGIGLSYSENYASSSLAVTAVVIQNGAAGL